MSGTLSNYFYFTVNFYFRNAPLTLVSTLLPTFFGLATLKGYYKLEHQVPHENDDLYTYLCYHNNFANAPS